LTGFACTGNLRFVPAGERAPLKGNRRAAEGARPEIAQAKGLRTTVEHLESGFVERCDERPPKGHAAAFRITGA
jgi:hypothetical protein